eukprot:c4184_g1_i1.p1 GENE.c4184_g1_i1~~c4184_g1_i1.p1  ORF type:complete len:192 (+),score=10.57 c4184_g1_i1:72-647(+)
MSTMFAKMGEKVVMKAGTMIGGHKELNAMILEEQGFYDHFKRIGEKEIVFAKHFASFAEQECTPFLDGSRQLSVGAEAALPISQNLINVGNNEVELLKQVLAKSKGPDKARDALASAEKTKKGAKLQSDKDAADREVETAKANLEQAEAEYIAYAQDKVKDAMISRQKALMEYHQEMMRHAQQNLEILQSM